VPISGPERLLVDDPVTSSSWPELEEILRQQAEYRRRGGKFIIPIPELRII
jgi:hypothetical protein